MRTKRTDSQISTDAAALLDLLRDVRDELRYLRQELRDSMRAPGPSAGSDGDELLTVEQAAAELQVIPPSPARPSRWLATVRSGSSASSRQSRWAPGGSSR